MLVSLVSACTSGADSLGEQQAVDAAWHALEPNTSSHERANWAVVQARQVAGREVAAFFEGEPAPGCWMGPQPQLNAEIRAAEGYWYIEMQPRPATPDPQRSDPSPTAPPAIPEPFLRGALLLVDAQDGQIVARKLFCVIY
jgi:hypothetical protein